LTPRQTNNITITVKPQPAAQPISSLSAAYQQPIKLQKSLSKFYQEQF
jgi:hypothetical protein